MVRGQHYDDFMAPGEFRHIHTSMNKKYIQTIILRTWFSETALMGTFEHSHLFRSVVPCMKHCVPQNSLF